MNLRILSNVMHNGTTIPGRKIKDNQVVSTGAVIDLSRDTRGLSAVAQDLIDRGLAEETNDPATHTLSVVNDAQEAYPIGASGGTAPVADGLKKNLAFQKEVAADKAASVDKSQLPAPAPVQTNSSPAPAPVAASQPSAAEVAAAAASVA